MILSIDDRELGMVSIERLSAHLASLSDVPKAEVWLRHESRSLCLLKSHGRAFLMLLRSDGDAGLTARATDQIDDRLLEFTLSNGQVDEYPASWTVPYVEAQQAMESFWFTRKPAPFITWVDETVP